MKKIILIEDRHKRQELFTSESDFDFEEYAQILDNIIEDDFYRLANEILNDSFSLSKYDIIICHKSIQLKENNGSNSVIISRLKEYCKQHKKILIFFSGGISANFYDNSEFELLEVNSKTFYSKNLSLFLNAVKIENEDIMMLCYGEKWKQNIVANVLEKINLYTQKEQETIVFTNFKNFTELEKLKKINFSFYQMQVNNDFVTLAEILKFRQNIEEYFEIPIFKISENQSVAIYHKSNLCTFRFFDDNIEFDCKSDDIDKYISQEIIKELAQKEFEILFIKDNLSSNYLELLGLRVAYHIRLSNKLESRRFTPIVIVSDFSVEQLCKFDEMANILFTPNVYLCKNTKEDIEKHQSLVFKELTLNEYKRDFLSKIKIDPPRDYLTHHSIANEWSIYRWANALHVKSDAVDKINEKIENMLYFKYLKAKHEIHESEKIKIQKLVAKEGKVILIDDEYNKGWGDILQAALQKDGVEFPAFEYDYKDKEFTNASYILLGSKIKSENPDVIILDLRLSQNDYDEDIDIENYTGIKLLQKIHEINAGIQVIMLTATSKSTILEKLYEKKILGYIKKEHPDDVSIDTVENINKLVTLVDKGLERKYLKEIWTIQNDILAFKLFADLKLSFDMDDSTKKLFELKNIVSRVFETLDSNIPKPFIYGMLMLYKCIEIINDYYIYEKFDTATRRPKAYWICDNRLIDNDGKASVNNKIKSILRHLKIQTDDLNRLINQISCTRNYEIHSGEIKRECEDKVVTSVNETHLLDWFKMIQMIIRNLK